MATNNKRKVIILALSVTLGLGMAVALLALLFVLLGIAGIGDTRDSGWVGNWQSIYRDQPSYNRRPGDGLDRGFVMDFIDSAFESRLESVRRLVREYVNLPPEEYGTPGAIRVFKHDLIALIEDPIDLPGGWSMSNLPRDLRTYHDDVRKRFIMELSIDPLAMRLQALDVNPDSLTL